MREEEDPLASDRAGQLPHAAMRRLVASRLGATPPARGGPPGQFLTLDEALDAYLADPRSDKRLAVAITGGGARGAWEAGVVEALTAACRRRNLTIDVVTGASVGSINALCTFVDALAPSDHPIDGVFSARQSSFWKRFASRNQAADKLLDLSWIIAYATNQQPLPGPGVFSGGKQRLEDAWNRAAAQLGEIGKAAATVKQAATSRPRGNLTEETGLALRQLDTDVGTLWRHCTDLATAWNNLHFADLALHPDRFRKELDAIGRLVADLAGDLARVDVDLLAVPLSLVADGIIDLLRYLGPLVLALEDLVGAIAGLIGDGGELLGALGEMMIGVDESLALLGIAVAIETFLIVGGVVINHIFTQDKLRRALLSFTTEALGERTVVRAWKEHHGHRPALYVAGTDLSCERQIVYALDTRERLDDIAASGVWIVDLADQAPATDVVFTPNARMIGDLAVEATLSSAALPIVFPPTTWYLDRGTPEGAPAVDTIRQVVVDGGVIDNSPLDLAVLAGATHVLLLELNPLLDAIEPQKPWDRDPPGGLPQVVLATLNTATDGGNLRGVNLVVALNALVHRNDRVVISRFAPLIPRTAYPHDGPLTGVSIDIVDFNGAYNDRHHLIMGLYDWFMQGYIDAKGWGPTDAEQARASDVVLQDYFGTVDAGFVHDPWWGANVLWQCGAHPLPTLRDLARHVNLPDRATLADRAAAR